MKEKNNDILYSKLISLMFAALMMFTVTKRILYFTSFSTIIAATISFTLPLFSFIKIVWKNKMKINYRFILLSIFIITFLYIISYFRGVPPNYILQYYAFTIFGLFLLYFTFSITNLSILYDEMIKKSFFISIVSILIIFSNRTSNPYNMRFSYILSIALLFQTIQMLKNFKLSNLIFVIMDAILILIYGSRGPLLCYAVFLIIYFLFNNKKIYLKILFTSFVLGIIFYFDKILLLIQNVMIKFNIMSRTLYLMINDFGHNSGRDLITEKTISLINEHSLFGVGIAGQFKYMHEYPHNLILDLFLHWGVIIGCILLLIILFVIIRAFIIGTQKEKLLLSVFISYGLAALMFSGTYLSWDGFYVMIGLSLRILRNKKELSYGK